MYLHNAHETIHMLVREAMHLNLTGLSSNVVIIWTNFILPIMLHIVLSIYTFTYMMLIVLLEYIYTCNNMMSVLFLF